jgi:hypothetical protein
MSNFLEYLNNAEEETLLKLKGLSKPLVERLIAGRPFAAVEDSLKVEGMNEKLLAKLQTAFTHQSQPLPTELESEAALEKTSSVRKPTQRWVRVLRWALIVLILLGAIYAAILYGVPFIYNTFLRPVENNASRLSEVAALQASDAKRLEGEIVTLQERALTLESRTDAVEIAIAAHDKSLASLESLQSELEQKLNAQDLRLSKELTYQIDLLRAIDYLSRSRLYLSQSNFGLAREDALSARTLLGELLPSAPVEQTFALTETINRLDLALSNLPAYPVVAVYDIDIAWQYLADGLNAVAPTLNAPASAPTEATPVVAQTPVSTPVP